MFTGIWRSDAGSELRLCEDSGVITGTYVTAIGDHRVRCREHRLVGRCLGTLVGFVVAWPEANSLTSWTGRLVLRSGLPPELHSMWHLVRETVEQPPRAAEPWESFLTYSSVFRKDSDTQHPPEAS